MWSKVESVLDDLRPLLQSDGGDVELVDVLDGVVSLRLMGACGTCPSSTIPLKNAIERSLREEIPEIERVEQVA